ncbi:MAG TPA: F0F1 ATP synthase subunit epsilon [Candidatus Binatia bacterium]|jgi:F-type H+-transporting ATPase subunit epsilon
MADKIQLRIVTPTRLVVDEEVDEVTAPGVLGQFGVLPNHIAFLTLLQPGELFYKQGGRVTRLAIAGGYAEVLDNVMTVLADAAEFAGEIDVARAERAKERAENNIAGLNVDDREFAICEAALARALARIQVASREARG